MKYKVNQNVCVDTILGKKKATIIAIHEKEPMPYMLLLNQGGTYYANEEDISL